MANKIPCARSVEARCRSPVCSARRAISRSAGISMPAAIPFSALNPEQLQFVVTFVRCEGRFNRMEEELKLSYPTLRSRFNDILAAMGFEPGKEEAVNAWSRRAPPHPG